MKSMKMSKEIAVLQVRQILGSADFWIVIITLFVFLSVILKGAGKELLEMKQTISVFSVASVVLSNVDGLFLISIGMLFLISDIPRGYAGYESLVLRTSRKTWYNAQWFYSVAIGIVYFIFIHLCAAPFFLPQVVFQTLEENGHNIFLIWSSNMLLFIFLTTLFAGICCVCNLLSLPENSGVLICGILIFLYRLYAVNNISFGFLSPIEIFSCYKEGNMLSFIGSAVYFLLINMCLFILGAWSVKKTDIAFDVL